MDNFRSVAATILVNKEGEYLIVKKPRKNHAWQFPQGGVEDGETLLEGAQRELKEECGAELNVEFSSESVGEYSYDFPKDFKRHDKNIMGVKVTCLTAQFISVEIELEVEELEDYAWVTKEAFGDYFEGEYLEVVRKSLKVKELKS